LSEKPPENANLSEKLTELTELTELPTVRARNVKNVITFEKVEDKNHDPRLYGKSSVSSVSSVSAGVEYEI
jgi:hypothetical protein